MDWYAEVSTKTLEQPVTAYSEIYTTSFHLDHNYFTSELCIDLSQNNDVLLREDLKYFCGQVSDTP